LRGKPAQDQTIPRNVIRDPAQVKMRLDPPLMVYVRTHHKAKNTEPALDYEVSAATLTEAI
jgi:hypothetical protein